MDDVNSCFLCKSLNLEVNSVDVSGSLLENIIKIKVLGDLPVDLPLISGKLRMCHDCLTHVEGIQSSLTKLKERIVKRKFRVRYANVHFTKSQNSKIASASNKPDGSATSNELADDCDDVMSESDDGHLLKSTQEENDRRDSLNSVISSASLSNSNIIGSAPENSQNVDSLNLREVNIKVPASVNATFIVVQSPDDITDHGSLTSAQSVHSLLEKKQVCDVITVPAFSNAQHLDMKRIDSPSVSTTQRQNSENIDNSDPQRQEPFKKRRSSFVTALDNHPALPVQSNIQYCRSLNTSPDLASPPTSKVRHMVPKIITPEQNGPDRILDLSHPQFGSNNSSPQLIPEDSLQDYLNQRRRSYDVHYPAQRLGHPLQHIGLMHDCSPAKKQALSHMSGGSLHHYDQNEMPYIGGVPNDDLQKPFHCDICGKIFERKGLWKRHMLSAHQDKAFTCSQCGLKFVDRMGLHIHESREHGHIAGSLQVASQPPRPPQVPVIFTGNETDASKDQSKVRKKMQYCEDCREHFTSKYDLLRHRVTTGHMGGAGGVCSDRGETTRNQLMPNQGPFHPNPYDALRKPQPYMKLSEVDGVRRFRRMESIDDSAVPYIKAEDKVEYYHDSRRRSDGSLLIDRSRLEQMMRERADECMVYSNDGQHHSVKVTSTSDKGDDQESP